jgi:RNA polymerase sigma-70 factor, ECF subfamily
MVTQQTLVGSIGLMAGTDEDALENAIHEHARLVYRIAYSVLRNHHDAEDSTQETFMRVLRYKRKFEGVEDPKTWLAKIAWRVAVERSRRRGFNQSLNEAEMQVAAMQLRSDLASAEESVLGNEMTQLLTSLILALPESLRAVLRLSTVDELSAVQIAHVLGSSESAVRSRLFRAREILKEKLLALEGKYGNKT